MIKAFVILHTQCFIDRIMYITSQQFSIKGHNLFVGKDFSQCRRRKIFHQCRKEKQQVKGKPLAVTDCRTVTNVYVSVLGGYYRGGQTLSERK